MRKLVMIQNIEPVEAFKKIYKNDKIELNDDVILLDVRTPEEFGEGHPPNAINIDHMEVIFDIKKVSKIFSGKSVYVICHSGARSELVTNYMTNQKMNAVNILGGMDEWESKNLPVVR